MAKQELLIPPQQIEPLILWVRGHKVILDANLAVLFGTSTKNLNKAVKRNRDRFPDASHPADSDGGNAIEGVSWLLIAKRSATGTVSSGCS